MGRKRKVERLVNKGGRLVLEKVTKRAGKDRRERLTISKYIHEAEQISGTVPTFTEINIFRRQLQTVNSSKEHQQPTTTQTEEPISIEVNDQVEEAIFETDHTEEYDPSQPEYTPTPIHILASKHTPTPDPTPASQMKSYEIEIEETNERVAQEQELEILRKIMDEAKSVLEKEKRLEELEKRERELNEGDDRILAEIHLRLENETKQLKKLREKKREKENKDKQRRETRKDIEEKIKRNQILEQQKQEAKEKKRKEHKEKRMREEMEKKKKIKMIEAKRKTEKWQRKQHAEEKKKRQEERRKKLKEIAEKEKAAKTIRDEMLNTEKERDSQPSTSQDSVLKGFKIPKLNIANATGTIRIKRTDLPENMTIHAVMDPNQENDSNYVNIQILTVRPKTP